MHHKTQESIIFLLVTIVIMILPEFIVTTFADTSSDEFCEAVDNCDLTWSTQGDAPWNCQYNFTYFYGNDCAKSGSINHTQSSEITANVTGPGILQFYWKVDSEKNYDFLNFYIDGVLQDRISGNVDWQPDKCDISTGFHVLTWEYKKDYSISNGSDCGWLDYVTFTIPSARPDLVILDIWNVSSVIHFRIQNIGDVVVTGSQYTALYINGNYTERILIDIDLNPGEQWEGYFNHVWNCTTPNDNIEVIVDYEDDIPENNEANNNRIENWICANNMPYPPSNPNPEHNEKNISEYPILYWTGGDPDPFDVVTYDVYFGTTSNLSKIMSNLSSPRYNLENLSPDRTYYWMIVAWDNRGASTEGPVWQFTTKTGNLPPEIPQITGPIRVNAGKEYEFSFVAFDPNGDELCYNISWGDTWESTEYFPSGTEVRIRHTWGNDGTYTIKVQSVDESGANSGWGSMAVIAQQQINLEIIIAVISVVCAVIAVASIILYRFYKKPEFKDKAKTYGIETMKEAPPVQPSVPFASVQEPQPRYSDFTLYYGEEPKSGEKVKEGHALCAKHWYQLEVAVRVTPTGILFNGMERIPMPELKQKKNVKIMVTAEAEDSQFIEIKEHVQHLILPPTGDSIENAFFNIRPLRKSYDVHDLASIHVRLYYEFNLLEFAEITAEVVSSADDPAHSQMGLDRTLRFRQKKIKRDYIDFDDIKPRTMHIHVTKRENHFLFNFAFYNAVDNKVVFTAAARIPATDLEDKLLDVRNIWNDIAMSKTFTEGLEGDNDEFLEQMYKLAKQGSILWGDLFKHDIDSSLFEIGKWLEEHPLQNDSIIQVSLEDDATDFVFPWSLIYDLDIPEKVYELDVTGFWGIRYSIEQRLPGLVKDTDTPVYLKDKMKMDFMLWDQFPNADKQKKLMDTLTKQSKGKLEISAPIIEADVCYNLLKNCDSHVLYFYTHGYTRHRQIDGGINLDLNLLNHRFEQLDQNSVVRETIKMIIETIQQEQSKSYDSWIKLTHGMLYLEKLYKIEEKLHAGPLVILNMCESAQVTPSLSDSFIHFFMNRGARSVIGTESPMTIEFAHPFAEHFLTEVLKGKQVGMALLDARRHFLDLKNPLGLAYTLFGLATIKYKPPRL